MIPRRFEYFTPKSLKEAVSLMGKYREDARILAGGHSLIPLMKLRLASPKYVIDINRVPNLSYIKEGAGRLLIGALARHHEIEASGKVRSRCPILSETASVIGDPQVRSLGTIGGALSHVDPAGDYGAAVLALDAELKAVGPRRERTIKARDFFVDVFTSSLRPYEMLTEVRVPIPPVGSGGAYQKFERKAGDFATVGAAAQLTLDGKGVCIRVGIGLVAVGPTPIKANKAERALLGRVLDEEVIKEAAKLAAEESRPSSDLRGSEEYKREMVKVFLERALRLAIARAKVRS